MAQHHREAGWRRFVTWRNASRLLIALFVLMVVAEGVRLVQVYQEKVKVEKQLEELKEENAKVEAEKEELSKPSNIESIARKELGLVKPGEMPYVK